LGARGRASLRKLDSAIEVQNIRRNCWVANLLRRRITNAEVMLAENRETSPSPSLTGENNVR